MKWPWVSRLAYEQVIGERDRLRDRNDELADQLVRIARREHKMPEVPRDKRESTKKDPLPPEIEEIASGWESPQTQAIVRQRARQLKNERGSWDAAAQALKMESGE